MDEIRASIGRYLDQFKGLDGIRNFSFLLVFFYPVFRLINIFTYHSFFVFAVALTYVIYLAGLVLCFADGFDWAMGAAFSANAIYHLYYLFQYIQWRNNFGYIITELINLALYGFLAFLCFYALYARGKNGAGQNAGGRYNPGGYDYPGQNGYGSAPGGYDQSGNGYDPSASYGQPGGGYDPSASYGQPGGGYDPSASYGQPGGGYDPNASYGQPEGGYDPNASYGQPGGGYDPNPGYNNVKTNSNGGNVAVSNTIDTSSPTNLVLSLCGNVLALVFAGVYTAYLLFNLIASFSFLTLIASIPGILMCVGAWMISLSCRQNNPNMTGFSLLNAGMIVNEVVMDIVFAICIFTGIGLIQADDYFHGLASIGIGIIIGVIIGIVINTFFWKGLRKTSNSARKILQGQDDFWATSMFSIVLIILGAVNTFIGIFAIAAIRSMLYSYMNEFSYYLGASSSYMYDALNSVLGNNGAFAIIVSIINLVVSILAIVLLFQIRGNAPKAQQGIGGQNSGYGQGGQDQGYDPYGQSGGYDPQGGGYGNPGGYDPQGGGYGNPGGYDPQGGGYGNPGGYDPQGGGYGNPGGYDPNGSGYGQSDNSDGQNY